MSEKTYLLIKIMYYAKNNNVYLINVFINTVI